MNKGEVYWFCEDKAKLKMGKNTLMLSGRDNSIASVYVDVEMMQKANQRNVRLSFSEMVYFL